MRNPLKIVGISLVVAALVILISFVIVTARLGGDAVNGKVEDGHFYLFKQGGGLTQVSEQTWHNDRNYTICVMVAYPLGMLGGIALIWLGRRRGLNRVMPPIPQAPKRDR
jgi:hypothetical protein